MRPFFLIALIGLGGCSESDPPGPPIVDGDLPDVPFFPIGDGGGRDASDDGDVSDSGTDGSLPFACAGAPFDLRAAAPGSNVEIGLAASATDFVLVWTITEAGTTDVYARGIPATGDPSATWQLTVNDNVESSPAVVARGATWLVAWLDDTLSVRDVFTYGLDPLDPVGATSVNVSADAADDGAPRLFDAGSGSVLLWHRPASSRANVTTLDADGNPTTTITSVDMVTNLPSTPYVVDRSQGPAALVRTETDTIGLLPLTAAGISTGAGLTTLAAPGATTRLAFSRVGTSSRVFVEAGSSITMRGLEANGELSGSTSAAPTSGANERAPAAVGHDAAHLLAYRTTISGVHTVRVATLRASNGALISDTPIATLASVAGDVAIARAGSGAVVLVYTDVSGGSIVIRGVRLSCAGVVP